MMAGSDFKVCPGIQDQFFFKIKDEIRRVKQSQNVGRKYKSGQLRLSALVYSY